MKIAFLGLGNMGSGMASRLLAAGHARSSGTALRDWPDDSTMQNDLCAIPYRMNLNWAPDNGIPLARFSITLNRHCEERSDEAIQ